MSAQGIILIDLFGLGFIALIINLVRTHRLHVGYGIMWLVAVVVLMVLVSLQPLLALITMVVGARFPASTLSLLAFVFIFGVLIFFSMQLTRISNRQIDLIQDLALKELRQQEKQAKNEDSLES